MGLLEAGLDKSIIESKLFDFYMDLDLLKLDAADRAANINTG